ncbi:MAG: bifunctional UDP-N-acetylglucosamine diphosphorylase/glucosamine-1-phosphate N-acetyltransferase GlmU [Anaerolineae bacterium]|nr:bifunctional UDP-N-acetylglucosamine diphosphorylase/glucosamine-1-phosphate N-acetyltransferase GlmU [Anaerolineae bacterium]
MNLAVVIMAVGIDDQMKSKTPASFHPILGKPMLGYVLETVKALNPVETVVIVGPEVNDRIQAEFGDETSFVIQSPQSDRRHAVQQARALLERKADAILTTYGNMPLLSPQTLQDLVAVYQRTQGPLAMLVVEREHSFGLGRVVRDEQGAVQAVVEKIDCTPEQRAVCELNTGIYVVEAEWLWHHLGKVTPGDKENNYLTNLIGIAVEQGKTVQTELIADPAEVLGINNRAHLAHVEAILRQRVNQKLMESGVTMLDPATTYIELGVTIGPDTVIYPNTFLMGQTTIGRDCIIGPNSYIEASTIGDHCQIRFSVVEQAVMENNVDIGPFGHLRKGSHLAEGVHMGNFGEVKNSYLGPGTKMGHFSYLGDAAIGTDVNIGAGTITCNYDGVNKHQTNIGDGAFIGSDTMLVAPVNIGKNAKTGAGSVVKKDVPDGAVAYGVPARLKDINTASE